jgi:hypothetical protein
MLSQGICSKRIMESNMENLIARFWLPYELGPDKKVESSDLITLDV